MNFLALLLLQFILKSLFLFFFTSKFSEHLLASFKDAHSGFDFKSSRLKDGKICFSGRLSLRRENDETLSVKRGFKRRGKEDEHSPHLNSLALRAPVSQRSNRTECVVPPKWGVLAAADRFLGWVKTTTFSLAQRGSWWLTGLSHMHTRVQNTTRKPERHQSTMAPSERSWFTRLRRSK